MDVKLRALLDDIEQAIGGMSPEAMERAPEGKWCVRDVLEHLSRAYGSTARALFGDRISLHAADPMGEDRFHRFNQTLQEFIDAAARLGPA